LVAPAIHAESLKANPRPELEALNAKQKAAQQDVRAAELQRTPRLSGFGDYGAAGAGPDRSLSTYTVGASLTIPLWTGRRIESEVAQAKLQVSQVEQETRRIQLQIQQEIRAARIGIEAAQSAQASAERGREAAREAVELARLRFESGLATSVDVQVAQGQLATADDTRIRAAYDLSLSEARLAKALGALKEALQ
jgi:outer membrane protein TolC